MIRNRFVILLISIFIITNTYSKYGIIDLEHIDNYNIIITKPTNLMGKNIILPSGGRLIFKKNGYVYNGKITGNNTKLICSEEQGIFENIILKGNWRIEKISTKLFRIIDKNTLNNISVLMSHYMYNEVKIYNNCLIEIPHFTSHFIIKSYSDIYLYADICSIPTKFKGGYAIEIDGSFINIYGNGHNITGTITIDKKNKQQWQHGIFIRRNSSNILIRDINIKEFWGDGIYIMGKNIIVDNIESKYNGRQGLSITHGKNIIIKNSLFHNTGKKGICSCKGPGAGIDIEPNKGDTVRGIIIENCKLYSNYKYMEGYTNDLQIYNAPKADVTVKKCKIGGVYIGSSNNIVFDDCSIRTIYGINKNVRRVLFNNCGRPKLSNKLKNTINFQLQ